MKLSNAAYLQVLCSVYDKNPYLYLSYLYYPPLFNSIPVFHRLSSCKCQQWMSEWIYDMLCVYNVLVKCNLDFTRKLSESYESYAAFLVVPIPVFLVSNFDKYYREHLTVYKQDDVYVGQKTDAPILSQCGLRLTYLFSRSFLLWWVDNRSSALYWIYLYVCLSVWFVIDTRIP